MKRIDFPDAREVGLASNGRAITGCSRSEFDLNDIGDCRTDSGTGERESYSIGRCLILSCFNRGS